MKSRIAIFEGYASPFRGQRSYGRPLGRPPTLGRRGYYVPPRDSWAEVAPANRRIERAIRSAYPEATYVQHPGRAAYKVRKMKDTPAMKRAQSRMKKAAKKCRGKKKGAFKTCMRRALKSN